MFKTIKRIIHWCGECKPRLFIGFLFSFLSTWAAAMPTMVAAYTLGMIIDDFNGTAAFDKMWILYSFLIIIAAVGLRFLFDYLRARYQESISYELAARDRIAIGNTLKRVSLGYFEQNSTGNILNAVTTGINSLEMMGIRMVDNVVNGYLIVFIVFIFFICMRWEVALIALLGVGLSLIFLMGISKLSRKNAVVLSDANKDLSNSAIEYARGLAVVKSFGQSGVAINSMKNACKKSKDINIKIENSFTPNNCLHKFALYLATIAIIGVAVYFEMTNVITLPIMLMLCMFSFSIFAGVEPISDSAHVLSVIDEAMDKIDALKKDQVIDKSGSDIALNNYDIKFDNVSFGYGKRKIIKNVNVNIPQNKTTAIVGPSGSGKSTLCNLIARFYDVNEGSITIGGYNVKEFTCDSLLKNISMVFQNVYLFNDTIRSNICFGKENVTEEEMIEAAKKARCHDFIMKLPSGYDTVLGEGGNTLSGGEKQRISIARAILKNAPIVILDEATASVDPENEKYIQEAISELTHGKTIIIIAHRLATIENADQILVLDKGKIAEHGSHSELVKQNGLYNKYTNIRKKAENWNI